jgi:hypothetical protein
MFSHDFNAENLPTTSCVWADDASEMRPGQSVRCSVIFDVPTRYVQTLNTSGNVVVRQFGDADALAPKGTVGIIRTTALHQRTRTAPGYSRPPCPPG